MKEHKKNGWFVFAEVLGLRFVMRSGFNHWTTAEDSAVSMKLRYPSASFFIADQSRIESYKTHGGAQQFRHAYISR